MGGGLLISSPMVANNLLTMQNISKTFPGVMALDSVDFDLRHGEIHVLLGENGAGKSTLIKILSGAYPKDKGEILINEKRVEIDHPKKAVELGISVIYQEFTLNPFVSVAENIFLGREPTSLLGMVNWKKVFNEAAKILERVGMPLDPRVLVRNLGVAQRQIVEIAKALSLDAAILILDEPTAVLPRSETEKLFSILHALKKERIGIIYISHRLEEVKMIGDRATVLRDGKKIDTVCVNDVETDTIVQMMVGRKLRYQPLAKREFGSEALRVEGLARRGVFEDINFHVRKGEILCFTGLVGAGRTEVAKAIFGAEKLDEGKIFLFGREIMIKSPAAAVSLGIAYLSENRQDEGLVLKMSIQTNITLSALQKVSTRIMISEKKERREAARFRDELSIHTPSLRQLVKFLSGGNQQKVLIAKWLLTEARVLIFDEPTRGIDVGTKEEIHQIISGLAEKGVAIIVISSELPEVLKIADRIIVMRGGKIADEMDHGEANQEKIMQLAVGGNQTQ